MEETAGKTLHDIAMELLRPLGNISGWSSAELALSKKCQFSTGMRVIVTRAPLRGAAQVAGSHEARLIVDRLGGHRSYRLTLCARLWVSRLGNAERRVVEPMRRRLQRLGVL